MVRDGVPFYLEYVLKVWCEEERAKAREKEVRELNLKETALLPLSN